MNDKLVYDLSQETEGVPNVFIRKDWLNILDNQNGNYQGNQSVFDTSQISNSNKFMNYREAYLTIPLLLTMAGDQVTPAGVRPNDGAMGLKNWFGNMIHSFTLDYNGSTVIQQTNFINMWNSFKLLTSLSYDDIALYGSSIGFYPDTPDAHFYDDTGVINGIGFCNNDIAGGDSVNINTQDRLRLVAGNAIHYKNGNKGIKERIKNINFHPDADPSYNQYTTNAICSGLHWSNVSTKSAVAAIPVMQVSVLAVVYLRHLSSFFNFVPLLKGAFMKATMTFNSCTTEVATALNGVAPNSLGFDNYRVNTSTGGTNPLLIPSILTGNNWLDNNGYAAIENLRYNISIGDTCLDNQLATTAGVVSGNVGKNIYLYVPAYSFNPQFYDAYIQSSPKRVVYTDVYQYQVQSIGVGQSFNTLISNGIPNIKSVLVIPFLKNGLTTIGVAEAVTPQWQSPFDPAGSGTTAPLVNIKNFQVQISGQNMIYNNQQYTYEEFNNQLLGCNGVNGGLTDGLTSGLIDFQAFKNTNCYYYVNVERMLPSEKNVPKSVQISGLNQGLKELEFIVFIEYENSMSFDLQTGARIV